MNEDRDAPSTPVYWWRSKKKKPSCFSFVASLTPMKLMSPFRSAKKRAGPAYFNITQTVSGQHIWARKRTTKDIAHMLPVMIKACIFFTLT